MITWPAVEDISRPHLLRPRFFGSVPGLDADAMLAGPRAQARGFNGATVTTQSTNLINASVPGKGVKEVEQLVGTTARLRFRQVLLTAPNTASSTSAPGSLSTTANPQAQGQASLLTKATKALFDKLNCANPRWRTEIYGTNPNNWDNPAIQTVTCFSPAPGQSAAKYALDKAYVTGEMVKLGGSSAQLQSDGDWWAKLSFNAVGTKAFGQLSTKMYDAYQVPAPTCETSSRSCWTARRSPCPTWGRSWTPGRPRSRVVHPEPGRQPGQRVQLRRAPAELPARRRDSRSACSSAPPSCRPACSPTRSACWWSSTPSCTTGASALRRSAAR
jgi:hypothetical protein